MKRADVKNKLYEILESFHPQDMQTPFILEENEYELLINTVWQYSEQFDEEEKIHPKSYIDMLRGIDSRNVYISKILRRLLSECGQFNLFKKSV
jgi:hypothetical protein